MKHKTHPLEWPSAQPRASEPSRSRFNCRGTTTTTTQPWTVAKAYEHLTTELERFDATNVVISTNVEVRIDGHPRSDRRAPDDCGIAAYFNRLDHRGVDRPYCMAVDVYDRVADNLHALALVIDSYRSIERHGGGALLEQATSGFAALPAATPLPATRADKLRALATDKGTTDGERAAAQRQLDRENLKDASSSRRTVAPPA